MLKITPAMSETFFRDVVFFKRSYWSECRFLELLILKYFLIYDNYVLANGISGRMQKKQIQHIITILIDINCQVCLVCSKTIPMCQRSVL